MFRVHGASVFYLPLCLNSSFLQDHCVQHIHSESLWMLKLLLAVHMRMSVMLGQTSEEDMVLVQRVVRSSCPSLVASCPGSSL